MDHDSLLSGTLASYVGVGTCHGPGPAPSLDQFVRADSRRIARQMERRSRIKNRKRPTKPESTTTAAPLSGP
jgi:hypothetical protein